MVRGARPIGIRPLIERYGGDADTILRNFGYDPFTIADPNRYVSTANFVQMVEFCAEKFQAPFFGLELSRIHATELFAPLSVLMSSVSTLEEALERYGRYVALYDPVSLNIVNLDCEHTEVQFLSALPGISHSRHGNEHGLGVILEAFRALLGPDFCPSYIRIAGALPLADLYPARRYFGCDLFYDQVVNTFAFPRAYLSEPIRTHNPKLAAIITDYFEGICNASDDSIEEKVGGMITALLPLGICSLDGVARHLGYHPRSLQIKLAKAGTEFSVLLADRRKSLAAACLQDTHLSLTDIAIALGYADQATFTRAFRGWYDTSPGRYRATRALLNRAGFVGGLGT